MHKLYKVIYSLIQDKERDEFHDGLLFTDEEKYTVIDTYSSFYTMYDAVFSGKYSGVIEYGKTSFTYKPYLKVYGVRWDHYITEKDFKNPTSIEVLYHECSPKYYGYDFFKKNLSMDDFMTFIHEHYQESEKYLIHD